MKKLIILLVTLAICQGSAFSQNLSEGISLCTQSAIDNFQQYYPGYTGVEGDVTIGLWVGSDITNLNGLKSLKNISGSLRIEGNPMLADLTGLSNLESVGGTLGISWNDILVSLKGLEKLTSIGGTIEIYWNGSLRNLSGLDNLAPGIISKLTIAYNRFLSSCEIESICECIAGHNAEIEIYNNAPGCNSLDEVEYACIHSGVPELTLEKELQLYPNPADVEVTIGFTLQQDANVRLEVMNSLGKTVAVVMSGPLSRGWHQIKWDAGDLPAAMYVYRLSTVDNRQSTMGKIVIR